MKTGASLLGAGKLGMVMLKGAPPKLPMLLGSGPGFRAVLASKSALPQGVPPRAQPGAALRTKPEPERPPKRAATSSMATGDPLDPVARQTAQLAPPFGSSAGAGTGEATDAPAAVARSSLEELLPALVRRVAWSGDGRKGTVRLELGAGGMAGAEVVVESDHGRVRVQLKAPAGVDGEAWRRRVEGRLTARGLQVDGVVAE